MKPVSSEQLALSLIKKLYEEKARLDKKDARLVTERDYKKWLKLKELEKWIH